MEAKARLGWIRLYQEIGDAGLVCRRCGISRPTLRKWWRRHQAEGEAGLVSRSPRPHRSPRRKVFAREEALILDLRRTRKLGIKRLRNALIREHGLRLALETIHKVLVRHGVNRLKPPRLQRKGERLTELLPKVPSLAAIHAAYNPHREWDRPHHYRWDPGAHRPD